MHNRFLSFYFLFFLVSFLTAQPNIGKQQLQALEYRLVGPTRGGRVSTVCGVQQAPFTFYMGTTGGGVWKTTDAGTSWENISDGYFKVASIGAIAVAPSNPNIIYVGTGSPDPRGNVSVGRGLYKSTDAGESWRFLGMENAGQVGKIVIHPTNPDLVWVGVLGNIFGPSTTRGVYKSVDGGANFKRVLYQDNQTGCIDLDINPQNPQILFAGMWTVQRKPWTLIDGSEKGGLWKSIDGGEHWKKVNNGLPNGKVGRIGLSISPANPKRIWVIQEAEEEKKGGLYRSDDGGATFKRINRKHKLRQRAWYYNRILADPVDEHTVYIMNVSFHKSIDGGKSFERISTHHGDNHALWINPDNPKIMVEGNDGGGQVTLNGGKTWSTINNQATSEFYRLSLDNQFPYRLYAAQQDNSTISVSSRKLEGLSSTSDWKEVGGGESGHIAVDPRDPNLVYASTYAGIITRQNKSEGYFGGDINAYPQLHDGTAFRDMVYRFQWNAPVRISPHDPAILYHCSQYVHRTKDSGQSWEVISPDLTTNNDAYHDIPGGPIQHDHTGVEVYTTIFAFEESAQTPGELWAGTDDGRLHLSQDHGANWKEITPPNIPKEGTINMIELSSHAPGRAFIAVFKYRENDFSPYIFRTDNYGKTWEVLTDGKNGIPSDHYVRVVREDPNRKGLLYAGTEFGMYISFNDGRNWQSFQLNLPITPIADMAIKNKDLVVATHGRSFWILDDLSPLYEISVTAYPAAKIFRPRDAYRYQVSTRNTPAPIPHGAIIYFSLAEAPSKDNIIKLQIKDKVGKVRRTFSTQPKEKEEKLKAKKGLNRFVWDLKYEKPTIVKSAQFSISNTGGIKAPTGTHRIVLTSMQGSIEQKLQLLKDPRWPQTDEDLMAQYELAHQIKAELNKSHVIIRSIRAIRGQVKAKIDQLKALDKATALSTQGKELIQQGETLEQQLIQTKSETGQDPINYPPMLDNQIAYLYSVVNGFDNRPTKGQYQRYEDLKKELAPYTEKIKAYQQKVTQFNTALKEANLSGILFKEIEE